MVTDVARYTTEDFERIAQLPQNHERLLELIDGKIVEKMPTELHGIIVANLIFMLKFYQLTQGVGRVGTEVLHHLLNDPGNARQPDIVFYLDTSRPVVTEGTVRQMPDLVAEVKSPTDTYKLMREKAAYYLANGTQMVWLVYPEKRLIEVATANEILFLNDKDMLEGGAVLSGFSVAVAAIFAQ